MSDWLHGGRTAQKARTRRELLDAAARLMREGNTPTIVEVADAAGISRTTAYRYFPTQDSLLVEAALDRVVADDFAAVDEALEGPTEVLDRVDAFLATYQPVLTRHDRTFRTLLRLTLEEPGDGRPPRARSGQRLRWISKALEPAVARLTPSAGRRLASALAALTGEEARIVLADVCKLSSAEAEATIRWAAAALVTAALREERATATGRRSRART